jgi:hypothetical protein
VFREPVLNAQGQRPAPPNVVLILTDDAGYGTSGVRRRT